MKRLAVLGILLFAFIGLADSAYLAIHEANGTPVICNISGLSGCNIVTTSEYSRVLGIPMAYLGVLFYCMLFVLTVLELIVPDKFLRRIIQVFAAAGGLVSLYSFFLQAFVLEAFCIYCLVSGACTLFILAFAAVIEPLRKVVVTETPKAPTLPMPPTS